MPSKLPPLDYPGHFEVRYVSFNGGIRWKRDWINAVHRRHGSYRLLIEGRAFSVSVKWRWLRTLASHKRTS